MRVVLDCNVVIAAARTDGTCRAVILETARRHEVALSPPILAEYREVARRPRHAHCRAIALAIVDELERMAILVAPADVRFGLADHDDEVYLATAVAADAAALITGNPRHFPGERYGRVKILAPRAVLDAVAGYRPAK